ncbi:metallophosphoesterase [Candidatus Uabimicrobium sp. HlEnr_7]|uniref:metallophosphoesterase n=1 Tax=Candidatus Uabimicrobium helgolandensis TaxID=3095367 RepID=UPI0035572BC3
MKTTFIIICVIAFLSCSNIYIASPKSQQHVNTKNIKQTIYIAGDFGSPSSSLKDITTAIASDINQQKERPCILGLGDNLYVKGFPRSEVSNSKPFKKLLKIAKLFAKCRYKNNSVPLVTIPGNHDYNDDAIASERKWGNIAPWYFLAQISHPKDRHLFENWLFLPGNAQNHKSHSELYRTLYSKPQNLVKYMKPTIIPQEIVHPSVDIIAIDSELAIDLFAYGYDKLARQYLRSLIKVVPKNNNKWQVLLTHHSLESYAKHRPGKLGSFIFGPGWPQFPQWWHKLLLIPPFGTLATLGWWSIHYPQDIHSCAYDNYRQTLYSIIEETGIDLVISGHEHCTQVIELQKTSLNTNNTSTKCVQLVCGESAKKDPVTSGSGTAFYHTGYGYSQVMIHDQKLVIEVKDRYGNHLYQHVINK